ncbi:MAG: CHASE2 domain-containing protein [Cyanobacteriota bacterium]|nr:CHASE2 domain-containing protein [Cyanobacteriota bacterium]
MLKLSHWSAKFKQWWKRDHWVLLATGGIASCIILARSLGLLQSWELAAFDTFFHLRPPAEIDPRIVIVAIDENDLQQAGVWPLPDRVLAKAIENIEAAEPRAIGLDIYRDFPVEPGRAALLEAYRTSPHLIGIERLEDRDSMGVSPPPLLDQKQQVGFNNVLLDLDGRVRRGLLYWHQQGELKISFALKLALMYLESQDIEPRGAVFNPDYLQLGPTVFRPFEGNDGGYVRADDKAYQFIGNFRAPDSIEKVTMSDVLADRVPRDRLYNRIVLIGSMAPSLKDLSYIPHSTNLLGEANPIYGVELHANFVSQILDAALGQGHPMRVLPSWVENLWIVGWSAIGAFLVWMARSPLRSVLLLLLTVALLWIAVYGYFLGGWWLPWVPPLLGLLGAFAILTTYFAYQREELQRSKEFLQSAIDAIADPIFIKNAQYRWIVLNQAFCQFSGYPLEQLLGKSDSEFFSAEEAQVFRLQDCLVFTTGKAREHEEKLTDARGKTSLIATKRSLHRDAAGNLFLIGVIRDITERKRVEDELRRATDELRHSNEELKLKSDRLHRFAYYDSLTGLANRKLFYESLTKSLEWAEAHRRSCALLYLDLDGFKQVNDTWGHDLGDLLLKAVSGRITNCVRSSDLVSRLGGDEFTVILPGIKQAEDVTIVAQKILQTLSQPFMLEGKEVSVTASIGSSIYPDDGRTSEVLIKKADMAMFSAKRLGRDRYSRSQESGVGN